MNNTQSKMNPPLRCVSGISWPRSRHHLLVRLLSSYFGERFKYCEFYTEHLDCCRQFPCTRSESVNFTKNHDFKLDVEVRETLLYIVQYRSFFNSVVSDFELYVKVHGGSFDNRVEFNKFTLDRCKQYKKFTKKWIERKNAKNMLCVSYEELIADTVGTTKACIQLFSPQEEVDLEKLNEVIRTVDGEKVEQQKIIKIKSVGVHRSRDHKMFRFYDEEWQEMIDSVLAS